MPETDVFTVVAGVYIYTSPYIHKTPLDCNLGHLWPFGSKMKLRGRAFAHSVMGLRIDPSWGTH